MRLESKTGVDAQNPTPARSCDHIPVSRYDPMKSRWTWGSVPSSGFVDHAAIAEGLGRRPFGLLRTIKLYDM